jgi:hypothetical protein
VIFLIFFARSFPDISTFVVLMIIPSVGYVISIDFVPFAIDTPERVLRVSHEFVVFIVFCFMEARIFSHPCARKNAFCLIPSSIGPERLSSVIVLVARSD